jgi:FixJ family two-component response regulator
MAKADRIRQLAAANELLLSLSPQQQRALDLVATGQRDAAVAEQVGVSRQTVNVWRHQHPAFRAALHARRREAWEATLDRLRQRNGSGPSLLPPCGRLNGYQKS